MERNDFIAHRKEAYLLANRDPWLLWRLQALRAGYVPPLVNGKIPPELQDIHFGKKDDYNIEPLKQQAKRMRGHERGLIPKLFVILVIGALFMGGFCYVLYNSASERFKVNLINALTPRNEQHYQVWY